MGRRFVLAMWFTMAAATSALAQGAGSVTGRGTSAEGARPVSGVAVVLAGTTRAAITDSAGRFTLAGLQAGPRRLEARRIGFVSSVQTVTVVAGQSTPISFSLVTSPIELEAV